MNETEARATAELLNEKTKAIVALANRPAHNQREIRHLLTQAQTLLSQLKAGFWMEPAR